MTLRRMLAVTHETTLTGAPMNLLHLVTWISRNTDVEVHVLAVKDGPLRHRFEQVAAGVTVLDRNAPQEALGLLYRGLVRLGSSRAYKPVGEAWLRPQLRHLSGFDLVYLNSVTSVGVLPYLPPAKVVVNHVHELQVALRSWEPSRDYELFRTLPDRWIAASDAVAEMLVDDIGVPAEHVLTHHEFIDVTPFAAEVPLRERERRRREYRHPDGTVRIPADAAVVMGAGTIDWRKGADLFVQLATEVRRRTREPVHFVWVGGDLEGTDMHRLRSDAERSGANHVHFVGVKPDPLPWFAIADVFALTSREDPFPLVCLEHAAMGHPIVTYRNGGMPELLEAAGPEAALGVVDHLDVGAMADRVIALLGSRSLHRAAGEQLRAEVLRHHDVAVAAPRLMADLRRLVAGEGGDDAGSHR